MNYVSTRKIHADCECPEDGVITKAFEEGDSLKGVLPGTLESMIRLGHATASDSDEAKGISETKKKAAELLAKKKAANKAGENKGAE